MSWGCPLTVVGTPIFDAHTVTVPKVTVTAKVLPWVIYLDLSEYDTKLVLKWSSTSGTLVLKDYYLGADRGSYHCRPA